MTPDDERQSPVAGRAPQGHLLAIGFAVAVAALAAPAVAQMPALATFRSIHDLVLDTSLPTGDVAAASARLVTEFTGSACKGYTDQTRFVMQTTERGGARRTSDLRQMTVETPGHFTFEQSAYSNNGQVEQSLGAADRGPSGEITVSLRKPAAKEFVLPASVVFPLELLQATIAAATDGKRFLALDLYTGDGEGETVYATATVIGPRSVNEDFGDDRPIGQTGFGALPHWPLTVSYFAKKGAAVDATPIYTTSYVLYANGLIARLRINYGEFALVGTLTSLQPLTAAPCP